MKFVVDENLSPRIAAGLQAFGEEAIHLLDDHPPGTEDEVWIPQVAAQERIIITRDVDIKRHRIRSEIFRRHRAGAFVLRSKNASGWDLIRQIVWLWPEFIRLSELTARPFMYAVRARGERIERIL